MGLFHKREQIKIQLDEISFILYQIMLYNRDSPQSPTKKQKGIKRLQTVQFRRLQFSRIQAFKLLQTSQHNIDTKPLNLDYKSNEILLSSDAKLKHFLIPYYMRLKIKDVNKISYKESTAVMNASLIINIETTGLPQRFIKRMRSKLVLQINRCQQLKLKESNQIEINNQQYKNGQKTQLKITIRKQFTVHISKQYSKIFFSPFQQLVVIACFTLNSIYFYQNTLKVSFNSMQFMNINLDDKNIITNIEQDNHILAELLREIQYQYISKEKSMQIMNNKQKQKELINKRKRLLIDRFLRNKDDRQSLQIYFKEVRLELEKDVTSGDFQISKRLFGIHDSKLNYITQEQWKNNKNDSKQQIKNSLKKQSSLEKDVKEFREDGKDDHKKQEFKKFQYTHFYFTLYSDPFPGIFTILIPNIFLGMISLVVFIFKLSLIERTSIIATLLLGFIQLLPSMKEQIIDKSSLSLVQIITYIYTFMCFVSLFDSFNLHQNLLGNIAYYDQINLSAKLQTGFRLDQLLPENKYFVLSVAVNVALLVFIFSSILIFKIYENKYLIQPKNYRKSKDSKQSFFINIIGFVWRLIKYGIAYFKGKRLLNEEKNEQQDKKYLKYSDHQILSKFLKIPSKFSVKWSFFWCNKQCDLQLQKYNNSNKGNNKDYRPISHYDLSSIA